MELEETGNLEDSTHEYEDDSFYFPDSLLDFDLPDLVEFEGSEHIPEKTRDDESTKSTVKKTSTPIPSTSDEADKTAARFVFTCKVCKRTFLTLKSCEKHIIYRGHTYPLIGLLSSDMMNGETYERIVMPDSLDEREFKTIPTSDFLPIYMGKWSKDSDYIDGAHYQDLGPRPAERYDQPDVTQTQPKALEHGEIARAMKKLEECFQTRSSPEMHSKNAVRDDSNVGASRSEKNPDITTNGDVDDDFLSSARSQSPEIHENHEGELSHNAEEYNEIQPNDDLIDLKPYHNAETLPRVDNEKSVEHKIYVDFDNKSLVCEGCCDKFNTLNDAVKHWNTLRRYVRRTNGSNASEDGKFLDRFTSNIDGSDPGTNKNDIQDDFLKENTDSVYCENDGNRQEGDVPDGKTASDEGQQNHSETVDGFSEEWNHKKEAEADDDEGYEYKAPFESSNEKQNGEKLYDTSFVREEKEFLMYEGNFSKRKRKDKKGKKKKKKSKPLKYIRRAFMLTVMFLF